ncbi:CBS domain-containing protein [Halobacteroides halobius DSM 5150]|uniref:CBS domain-containing protein n=1 Tax=Halobacteroides halobius (strain ATCC 35273 / DSM 5150 / MD-1) TaxID=748449 RepID=L0KB95_HALHC|nr:hemolysin family protein [Halobacteroides halobius]AGB41795.1 CBS domain-containing protein [Halobacteroides halobius DSM 5150]
MEISRFIEPVIFFLCLGGSAFFSGSETALMSVNRIEIRHLKQEGDKKAAILEKLLSTPDRLIATILVGNNLVNIAASSIATKLAIDIFGNAGVGIATGVVTLLLLVFGEITPKSIANSKALKFSMTVARPIEICYYLFYPVVKILNIITSVLTGNRGQKATTKPFISEERIRRYLTVGEKEGVIETDEKQMINSIFEFDDTRVKEILVPRIDMICVEVNDSIEELIDIVVDMGLSRIPVYNDTVDNIVGIVYAKDLLPLLTEDNHQMNIQKIMRPAFYVPETKKVDNLLSELKKEKIHMAIILDEYGGTAGLVTIEDLLEEIVGDIQDEYDEEEKLIKMLEDDELLVDGRVDIDEINEVLGIDLPEEDYETISGFILSMLGYVPDNGERIEFEDLTVSAEEVVQRRISKVRIKQTTTDDRSENQTEEQGED